jgi:putative ABC transport system substrate-binding protein
MKKIISLVLVITVMVCSLMSLASCSGDKKVIGIMQFGNHESLNNCYNGIVAGLSAGGINLDDYEIRLVNDNFDPTVAQSHASAFVNSGVDIIISIATPSAVAAANAADGEIPVVFCAVTDDSVMENYENVTGSSDRPNFDKQLELVSAFMGKSDLKIGVLLSSNEDSSPLQLSELQTAAGKIGAEVLSETVVDITTIGTSVDKLISSGVDCFVNLLDNTVVGKLDIILEKTNAANIPVFGSEIEQVKAGCAASASIEYVDVGREAGILAAKILKGEASADSMETVIINTPNNCYNKEVLERLGIKLPEGIDAVDVSE